ncbi:MAG: phosphotransferase family protein [Acidobacteriota bacterium]|nr:phosphotransferase family protein [Acidobacteriota bacterium]
MSRSDDAARRRALELWLGQHLPGPVEIGGLTRPGAGQSSETFLFEAKSTARDPMPLVLRMQAGAGHIFPQPDAVLESRVLEGVAESGKVAVPKVIAAEEDPTILGAPFFVMEQVAGRVPQGKPSLHAGGWVADMAPEGRRHLWEQAMAMLVAVHGVPWRRTHTFLDPASAPAPDRLSCRIDWLAGWYRWAARDREYPVIDAGLEHLRSNRPALPESEDALVWGDARVGNMIFADDASVAAAVDWEVATVGRPEIDLAHWLFFDEFATDAVGVPRLDGWPDRNATIRRYQELSGRTLFDLGYFDIMQELFMAVTLIRQSDRRVEKGLSAPDSRMGHDNTVTQMLARRLGLPVPDLSPDWLAHRGVTPSGAGVSGRRAGGAA